MPDRLHENPLVNVVPYLLAGLLLSACAPTQLVGAPLTPQRASAAPGAPMTKSVFQLGQRWRVTWGDGTVNEYDVPAYEGFKFNHDSFSGRVASDLVVFDFTPIQTPIIGSDFTIRETVEISRYTGKGEWHCTALTSGPVAPGTELSGFFYRENHKDGFDYQSGKPVEGPKCRMKRLT